MGYTSCLSILVYASNYYWARAKCLTYLVRYDHLYVLSLVYLSNVLSLIIGCVARGTDNT